MRRSALALSAIALLSTLSCSSDAVDDVIGAGPRPPAAWAANVGAYLTMSIADPSNDYDFSEPPYSQPYDYPAADLIDVSFGVDSGYFFVRLEFDAVIPLSPFIVAPAGEVEAQTITEQSFSIVMDTDNDDMTGAGASNFQGNGGVQGVDVLFGLGMLYGGPADVYAHYGFPAGDIHFPDGQVIGELGAGGPGYRYVVMRYDVTGIDPAYWPAGATVEVGGWSEAESNLYHEFVNDFLTTTTWTVP